MSEMPAALARRFRLSRVLGAGGMGVVFLGELPGTGKPCAVKVVKTAGNERHRRRLEREARMLSRVRHPNLVEVYDLGVEAEGPWVAMELVEGRSLSELCKDAGPAGPDPDWLAEVIRDAAAALGALHEAGVMHRDVKPGNIMVDRRGRPVLMDLGLAVDEDASRLTQTGHLVGTVPFIAPEVFRGERPAPAADWYALGATVFRCMEGRYPFSQEQVFEMVGHQAWSPMPEPSERWRTHRLARAAAAMMDADPARRLARPAELDRILGLGARSGESRRMPAPGASAAEDRQDLPTASIAQPGRGSPGPGWGRAVALALVPLAVLLGLVRAGRDGAGAERPPASNPGRRPEETTPASAAEAFGRGPEALLAWARGREAEARARDRRADRSGAARARRGALGALRLHPGRSVAASRLRLELFLGLADPGVPGGVHSAWLERAVRALPGPDELARSPGPDADEIERIRDRLEVLGRRAPLAGLGEDPFPPVPPRPSLLWALRSYSIERLPADALDGILALGLGQGAGFEARDWAGDLSDHPAVLLAEARKASAWARTLPDPLAAALETSRGWRPAPGAGDGPWKLWFEHQYLAAVQAAHRASPGPSQEALAARSARIRELLAKAEPGPELLDLARGWTGLYDGTLANGLGRRRSMPLVAARQAIDRLRARLSGPAGAEPVAGFRTLIQLEAGYLAVMVRHMALDCDGAELEMQRLRGLSDWDGIQRAGVGGLFVSVASLDYGDLSPEIELCRATRLAYGTSLGMVRFLDAEPPLPP